MQCVNRAPKTSERMRLQTMQKEIAGIKGRPSIYVQKTN